MIVCKFGGTSVGDAEAVLRLVGIIQARVGDRPVVVVSALSGVTDRLLQLADLAQQKDRSGIEEAVDGLIRRHAAMVAELKLGEEVVSAITKDAWQVRARLLSLAGRRATRRLLDAIAGRGELWSAWLVAAALRQGGVNATWTDARKIVITDSRFTRATPNIDRLGDRARAIIPPLLAKGLVPVTQGFVGATTAGVPTTLGRGGSDFTAALLGAALSAKRVEIWTDVNGIMTADPRVVPEARTLAMASYDEAAELATFGAKVLHPATQLPLVQAGIPIVVLNSREPAHPGTTIAPDAELIRVGNSPVRCISWKKNITVINIRAPRMLGTFGFLRAMFEVFERHEVVVDVLASSEISISLTIEDRSRLEAVVRDLSALGEVWIDEHRAIIAVVGVGIRNTPGLAGRIFAAVAPTNVEVISQGASEINLTFVVRGDDAPDTVRRLHREFFGL
jgi:aspartate kinase